MKCPVSWQKKNSQLVGGTGFRCDKSFFYFSHLTLPITINQIKNLPVNFLTTSGIAAYSSPASAVLTTCILHQQFQTGAQMDGCQLIRLPAGDPLLTIKF